MFKGTTIVSVRRDGRVVVAGDGQVSLGNTVVKQRALKLRRLAGNRVVVGFAGSTADAMTLFEKLEGKLAEHGNNLLRAAVELAKEWRTDKYLRRLEAMMIAADHAVTLLISGTGDVLTPDDGVVAIGSGSGYALAAARALLRATDLDARSIAMEAMAVASEICVFTNGHVSVEEIEVDRAEG